MNIRNSAPHCKTPAARSVNGTALPEQRASGLESGCSRATLKLGEADLARSGLTLAQAEAEGIFPTDNASAVNPDFATAAALIVPYHDAQGGPATYSRDGCALPFCRARYLVPPGFRLPRGRKYDQPGDSGTPPYFSRSYDWKMIERGELDACVVVEGEKKAVALCQAGIPAVAIGGVFNFKGENRAPLHSALARIAGKCRDMYILFDSDAAQKPQIQNAEGQLATQFALLGARVHIVRIPTDGAEKVGADDYLLKHGRAALESLILSTPALGDVAEAANDDEITVAELLGREIMPVEELIPGWVEKGIPNFIAGPGGVHKSRLAMQWGLCINAGAAVWGIDGGVLKTGKPKATLVFCSAEDDANELARRAQAISAALKLKAPKQGLFLALSGRDSALVVMEESAEYKFQPFYHRLNTLLKSITGHKVVVLDSAYDFVRFVGRAKIDEDAVNYFIKVVLQSLCDQTDSTLLIPWHPSQAGSGRDSMDGWSVAWHNAPRARLAISEVKDVPDTFELRAVKRNHGPKGLPLTLKFYDGVLLPMAAVPDDGKAAALQHVCIKAAIEAANLGVPFNRRGSVPDLVFKDAEKVLGRRPSKQEVKNILEEALRTAELRYIHYTRHRAAGFYPPDVELAQDLARAAKRAARSSDDA